MAALAKPVEDAFKNGFVLAYDRSEADLDMEFLEEINEGYVRALCEDDLWKIFLAIDDEEDPEFLDLSEQEKREYFQDFMDDLAFFRFTGDKIPKTIEEAISMAKEFGF